MLGRLAAAALLLALAAFVVDQWVTVSRTQAQEPVGAEVRLAAQEDRSGSTSVGLQYRVSGKWRFLAPTRNVLPAAAIFDRWYTSSGIEVEVTQARAEIGVRNQIWSSMSGPEQFTITIGDTRYVARCGLLTLSLLSDGLEVQTGTRDCQDTVTVEPPELADPTGVGPQVLRIAARRLLSGGIEMGLQRLVDGQWEALRQPELPVLAGFSGAAWRFTSAVQLPRLSGHVSGELRRGATITTRDGELDLEVDGRAYRTHCGVLELDILTEHVLAYTRDEGCQQRVPLLTICPTSNCDVQQNAAYAWESRQIGSTLDSIELTLPQARAVVNALFDDYFPPFNPPRVSFSDEQEHGHGSRNEVVLGTRTRNLGAAVHELAHALVDRSNVRDAGHGGAFIAMLLDVWERYFPIVDIDAARDDARRSGLEVASTPPARAVRNEAVDTLSALLCSPRLFSIELCFASLGVMPSATEESLSGRYVGFGGAVAEGFWWSAQEDEDGRFRTHLSMDSLEALHGHSVARLSIECNVDNVLEVDVWWRGVRQIPASFTYRFGDGGGTTASWRQLTGTWGNDSWAIHRAPDAASFLYLLSWQARFVLPLVVEYEQFGANHQATFDIYRLFDTPAQRNLERCGSEVVATNAEGLVIDFGSAGDDFWWGVDEDDNPPTTWVVKQTNIIDSERKARLRIVCEDGDLKLGLYWEVDRDLDWTVRYLFSDSESRDEEWVSGWSTWGETEYKWTGSESAARLIAELAWAAQTERWFAARVWERDDTTRSYAAIWNLDGLFATPVQPNLARCSR
ncbi:MAG: hypothetical protein OXH38_13020 [Chloroflexi bacterium]|nr:hypothetical protein [Chloroflexota bacterium]